MHKREPELLLQIGYVCRMWSYLEYLLARIIWRRRGLNECVGPTVTGKFDMLALASAALAEAKQLGSEKLIDALTDLCAALTDLRLRRNRVVHGVYSLNENSDTMYIEHHREQRVKEQIAPEEIKAVGSDIEKKSAALRGAMAAAGIPRT